VKSSGKRPIANALYSPFPDGTPESCSRFLAPRFIGLSLAPSVSDLAIMHSFRTRACGST
jgi:hypothetical protein